MTEALLIVGLIFGWCFAGAIVGALIAVQVKRSGAYDDGIGTIFGSIFWPAGLAWLFGFWLYRRLYDVLDRRDEARKKVERERREDLERRERMVEEARAELDELERRVG